MSYAINLYTPVKESATAPLGNYTAQFRNWKDRTRAIGGYWTADCDFWLGKSDPLVSFNEAYEMFTGGLQRRVVRSVGSKVMWEGYLSGMTLTHNGRTYQRMHSNLANKVKAIYSRFGSDYLYNGSAELAGVYDPTEGGPTGGAAGLWWHTTGGIGGASKPLVTRTPSSTWATDGAWSYYVDNNAGGNGDADARFRLDGPVSDVRGLTLCLVAKVRLTEANSIAVQARIEGVTLYTFNTPAAVGVYDIFQSFEVPATLSLVDILNARFVDTIGKSHFYVDGVHVFEGGTRCDTPWSLNASSIARYGTIEYIILDAGSTDEAAASRVIRKLNESAWCWPTGPDSDSMESTQVLQDAQGDGLKLEFSGYAFSLGFKSYAGTAGAGTASAHLTNLIADSEFVTAGTITANTLNAYIELAENIRIWDSVEKIISAGDAAGNQWMGGVYAGRVFNYSQRPTTVDYVISNNQWLTPDRNRVSPELVAPAYVRDEDLPKLPGTVTGDPRDDPAVFWASEVEFVAPDKINVNYSQERD